MNACIRRETFLFINYCVNNYPPTTGMRTYAYIGEEGLNHCVRHFYGGGGGGLQRSAFCVYVVNGLPVYIINIDGPIGPHC